jgi:hypothetical protein
MNGSRGGRSTDEGQHFALVRGMALSDEFSREEHQLQVLDVQIVDILAHLEALLRNTHSIQRALLQLRHAAPPPSGGSENAVLEQARPLGREMRRECLMLSQIIDDVTLGLDRLAGIHSSERRSGADRRTTQSPVPFGDAIL